MRKNLQYKILVAIMAASAVNWALPANVLAGYEQDGNYYVESNGEIVNSNYNLIYGDGNSFTIDGGTISGAVGAGDEDYNGVVSDGNITINGNATVTGNVFGGNSSFGDSANDNIVNISGSAVIENANLYGSNSSNNTGNTLTINGWKGNNGNGDYTVKSLNNFDSVNFDNLINLAQTTNFTVGSVYNVDAVNINSIGAGDYRSGTSKNIKLTLDNNKLDPNKITL